MEEMNRIDVTQDNDRWRTVVNAVMKRFHKMRGIP
jgi:hypothetical protein